MARRAPFLLGVGGPFYRFERLCINLRHHVLHHLHLTRVGEALLNVTLEMGERVLAGAETVHQ